MRQKLQDFLLAIRSDRKTQVGVGLAAVFLGLAVFMNDNPRRQPGQSVPITQPQSSRLTSNSYEDLVQALTVQMNTYEEKTNKLQGEISSIRTEMSENTERMSTILRTVIDRLGKTEADASARTVPANPGDPIDVGPEVAMAVEQEPDGLEPLVQEVPEVSPPPPPEIPKVAVIGAGDSVRVKLLAGVNAPIDGSPYPMLMKLVSDVYGPDGSALPLGEARLIGAAQGSLTDSRVLVRLTSMNIRLPNGERKVIDVDGWVVGEDGIRGMQGILIDPLGKAIAGSMFAGAIAGAGEAVSLSQLETTDDDGETTTIIAGNAGEYVAGRSLKAGADQYRDLIRERLDQLVPQVQVLSGREATAVFARSVTIPGLFEALTEQGDSVMASLD